MLPKDIFQRITGVALVKGLIVTTLFVTGCAATTSTPTDQAILSAGSGGDADKLLIIDCLLPGQIRKLGQQFTFLTPRRPVKTTAVDCEIRGGEYVAYDRSNYATALKIWLPQAQAGDPVAQTYVGEIYEQGLGLAPDYALAAQWYRKAADQGYSRAQINLGFLYEQGLGVNKDPIMALNFYRRASGLTDDQLAFSSSIQALETERQALQQEVALRQQESATLREQLQRTQQELEGRRTHLGSLQGELEQTRRQLQQERSSSGGSLAESAKVQALELRLAEQQANLEQRHQEIAYLQQEAERQRAQLTAELQAVQRREQALSQDAASRAQEIESLQQQVTTLNQELEARYKNLESTRHELKATRQELQQLRNTASTPSNDAMIASLSNRLAEQEVLLAQQRREMDALLAEANRQQAQLTDQLRVAQDKVEELQEDVEYQARERESLQQQVDYLQRHLAAYQDQLNARKQELQEQQSSVQQAREEFERQLRTTESQSSAELQHLEQQLKKREDELNQVRGQIAKLEADIQNRTVELEALKTTQEEIAFRKADAIGDSSQQLAPLPEYPRMDFGHYHALIIGNNRYAHFPDLRTAINDTEAIAKVLEDRYGFSGRTRVLVNADRYAILSALNEFRAKLTEKDNFLLYYAGHGELEQDSGRGYWLPVDAEPTSTANWISNLQITDILEAMSAKHVMVIADSCYSGTMTRSVTTSIEGGRSEEKRNAWLKLMIETRSRTVLTSGSLKPVLDSGGGKHSVFAKVLLDVLKSNQEVLEGPLLYQKVAAQVRSAAAQLDVEQDPLYAPIKFAGDLGAPFFFAPAGRLAYRDIPDTIGFPASRIGWSGVAVALPVSLSNPSLDLR